MLRDIYEGMDVRGEVHREAFEETLRIFNLAAKEGLAAASFHDYGNGFLEQIKAGNEVFSAFRVHRMQNDMAARLLDGDGRPKPFGRWMEDIRGISSHYTARWLRTEYATAVIRAHRAADWKRFEAEQDVLPNVRWMPTTSPEPDPWHRRYWEERLTLPVGHPFWKRHRPGDRWNCKCWLMQTGEPVSEGFRDTQAAPPAPGLDNNPADDGRLFSGTHPYIARPHPGAKEAVEKLLRTYREAERADDSRSYTLIPTEKGRLRIHSGHGKNERRENIRVGKYLAEKHGYEIDLLDNPPGRKSPDSFNRTLGVEQEYKVASTPTANAIDRLIRDGRKQADDIVLWLDSDIPWEDVAAALRSRVRRSSNIKAVTVVRGGKDIRLSREDILSEGFKIRPADLE